MAYLIPFWLKIMLGRRFIIFLIFLLFFWEFFCPGRVCTELRAKFFFFFLFFGLSQPVLANNKAGKRFFNFLNFFTIFIGILLSWSSMNGIRDENFVLFFGISHPVLAKNNAGKGFYNFLNFLTIFFGIFLPESSMNGIQG